MGTHFRGLPTVLIPANENKCESFPSSCSRFFFFFLAYMYLISYLYSSERPPPKVDISASSVCLLFKDNRDGFMAANCRPLKCTSSALWRPG